MTARILCIFCMVFLSASSVAEKSPDSGEVYRDIANDLSNLRARIDRAYSVQAIAIKPARLTITAEKAGLLKGAMDSSPAIAYAEKGKTFTIVDKASNWYAVALDKAIDGQNAAWVNASKVVPVSMVLTSNTQTKSYADELYEEILEQVNSFKEKYKSNPYVSVSGFSINISMPPSVSVAFEFK